MGLFRPFIFNVIIELSLKLLGFFLLLFPVCSIWFYSFILSFSVFSWIEYFFLWFHFIFTVGLLAVPLFELILEAIVMFNYMALTHHSIPLNKNMPLHAYTIHTYTLPPHTHSQHPYNSMLLFLPSCPLCYCCGTFFLHKSYKYVAFIFALKGEPSFKWIEN